MIDTLDVLTALPDRVSIYIPSEFKDDIKTVSTNFNTKFGGSTLIEGVGSWNGSKGIEIEDITIIYSNVPAITEDVVSFVLEVANEIKVICKQEAVSVGINSTLYFI